MGARDIAIARYEWVKENIKYAYPRWGFLTQTLRVRQGHCGIKSELLVSMLRDNDIEARYVEGRPLDRKYFIINLLNPFDVHFWVEANIDGDWFTLDPTPDSGITHVLGDTEPGTHLEHPIWVKRWDDLPPHYKEGYNSGLFTPLRLLSNVQIEILRRTRLKR